MLATLSPPTVMTYEVSVHLNCIVTMEYSFFLVKSKGGRKVRGELLFSYLIVFPLRLRFLLIGNSPSFSWRSFLLFRSFYLRVDFQLALLMSRRNFYLPTSLSSLCSRSCPAGILVCLRYFAAFLPAHVLDCWKRHRTVRTAIELAERCLRCLDRRPRVPEGTRGDRLPTEEGEGDA